MKQVITILAAVALFTGCYKSTLTNTTHPDEGKVVVEVVLPGADSESGESVDPNATLPKDYTVILNGEEVEMDNSGKVVLPENLKPGEYTLYIYSNNSELDMANNITSAGEGTIVSSTVVDAGVIPSLGGDLYFGTKTITVLADNVLTSKVELKQVTRTVKFNLHVVEGDPDRIKSVTATLSGMAQQWECVSDAPMGAEATIEPLFERSESITKAGESGDYLVCSVKVLGVNGVKQILTLDIEYSDGKTQTIVNDLSDQFAGSNDNKYKPLILSGDLNTPIAGSTEGATIDNWTQGVGGSETVN